MRYFIIERQLNIEHVRVVAFVLRKLGLKKMSNVLQSQNVSCFGNSFMATDCMSFSSTEISDAFRAYDLDFSLSSGIGW